MDYGFFIGVKDLRLDKFLKVSRIIKRRTLANEACDGGKIIVNGKVAKASLNLNIGDIIEIKFKNLKVKVIMPDTGEYQIVEGESR